MADSCPSNPLLSPPLKLTVLSVLNVRLILASHLPAPSLVLKAVQNPEYAHLLAEALSESQKEERVLSAVDHTRPYSRE